MKVTLTIAWVRNVEVDVDPARLQDRHYIEELQAKTIEREANQIRGWDGNITDATATDEEGNEQTIHELID
jgi:hypothetical protein